MLLLLPKEEALPVTEQCLQAIAVLFIIKKKKLDMFTNNCLGDRKCHFHDRITWGKQIYSPVTVTGARAMLLPGQTQLTPLNSDLDVCPFFFSPVPEL